MSTAQETATPEWRTIGAATCRLQPTTLNFLQETERDHAVEALVQHTVFLAVPQVLIVLDMFQQYGRQDTIQPAVFTIFLMR